MSVLTFWCCRCLKNREAKELRVVEILSKRKSPRRAYHGICVVCKANVFRIVK